ncbi:hypothetical protein ES703_18109 [subsurface metagenome]
MKKICLTKRKRLIVPKSTVILPILFFLISIGYYLSFYNYGINLFDEGILVNGAIRILRGEIVYRDFFGYEPGRYYLFALLFKLFAIDLQTIRLAMVFLTSLAPLLVYLISRRIMSSNFALLAALMMLIAPGVYYFRLFTLFILLNLLMLSKYLDKGVRSWLWGSALVAAISIGFYQDVTGFAIVATLPLIVVHNLYPFSPEGGYISEKRKVFQSITREMLCYATLLALVGSAIYTSLFLPALRKHFIPAYFPPHFLYHLNLPLPRLFSLFTSGEWRSIAIRVLFENSLFYLPIAIYLIIFLLLMNRFISKRVGHIDLYLLLFFILGVLTFSRTIIRADFDHLFLSLPLAYILGCYLLFLFYHKARVLIRRQRPRIRSLSMAILLLPLILIIPLAFIADVTLCHGFYAGSIGILRGEHTLLELEGAKLYVSPDEAGVIRQVVSHIKEHTCPEDSIFALPLNPMWYFLCERDNPTSYAWVLPEMLPPKREAREDVQRQIIRDIHDAQTKYIIYHDWVKDAREDRRFRYYAKLIEDYIRSNYHLEKRIEFFDILRRNEVTTLHPFIRQKAIDSYDFILNLSTAKISTPAKDYISVTKFNILGEERIVLYEHPPARITYKLRIPQKARLSFGIGIAPTAWSKKGDGVLFKVLLSDNLGRDTLFSRYIDPKEYEAHRKWHDVEIDLSKYGKRKVLLSFITSPGPGNDGDYDGAGWSEPQMLWKNADRK